MGNSSSGIKEAVVFDCPTLNIGDRQKSRLKPNNVIDVDADKVDIVGAADVSITGANVRLTGALIYLN